jgi:hypothetical protein
MTTHDEDILDFDFFGEDEPPTWDEPGEREPASPRDRPPRGPRGPRGPSGPRRRIQPPGNLTPLLRLVALIALGILVVVLLAVWVEGCASDRKTERYTGYMGEVGSVGNASAKLGTQLATTLTTPALKLEDLDAKLSGFVQTAEGHVTQAEGIDAPGAMNEAHRGAIEALRYRVNGLTGLKAAFQATADATDSAVAGGQLAQQANRLLASDIVWADSFGLRAAAIIEDEGLAATGLEPPASEFVAADELASPGALAAIWTRIQGADTGGTPSGLHGSGIAFVRATPSGLELSTDTENEIIVTDELAFEVGVEDTGDSQEVQIRVTLTIPKTPENIELTRTIPLINPGETETVRFPIGTELPPFGEASVKIDVDPVPGETNAANNTAEYPVLFTLAP